MNEPVLLVLVEPAGEKGQRVLSPGVGWWSHHPRTGGLLGPGNSVGLFTSLNRRFALRLPDHASGRIRGALPRDRTVPVEYGQPLFDLEGLQSGAGDETPALDVAHGHPGEADLPEGCWAVLSPTDGVFYRRSSPEAPPFVEVGSRVRLGEPLGLVEVMKTFNQILYEGPGLPQEAEVVEIRVGEAEDVHSRQVLLVLR